MADVFKSPAAKSIPKEDARFIRIAFDCSEQGARKSALPKGAGKNSNTIKHV